MPKQNEITTKFNADITDLKAGITEANRQIKLANAEFKAASSAMDYVADSADGVQKKLDQLGKVYEAQNKILDSYRKQLEIVEKEQGSNSTGAENLRIKIANQQAAVNKTAAEIQNYKGKLTELEKAQEASASEATKQASAYSDLGKKINAQEGELAKLKTQYAGVVIEQGKGSKAASDLAKEIDELSGELADNKKAMQDAEKAADDLDNSLEETKNGADTASGGFTVMKGVLADLVANGIRQAINALGDFIKESIKVGQTFDSSMSEVAAISGATGEDLQMLRDTAKEFGATTVFSASESADALKYMSLAGWSAQESADALGGVLNLAAASGMDLAKASDMVTDYLSAFGLEAKDSARFADLLAYAQANSNTTAEALGEAFKNSAANMNAAGQDVETVTALLAMMANQGLKGSEAGTALTAVMRDMTAKMKEGKIAIGETSVEVMDASGNYRDLTDILTEVENATQGMGDAERATALQATFTADSIKGLNLILNAGTKNAAKFEGELKDSTGTAKDMADIMQDNLGGDMKAFNSQLEGVQIMMYEKFEPELRAGIAALSALLEVVEFVIKHSTEFTAALGAMAAGIAAYVAYTTALKVMEGGWMSLAIAQKAVTAAQWLMNAAMAANPIGLVVAAIAALVAAFVILWNKSDAFRAFWMDLWEAIKMTAEDAWDAISGFFTAAWEGIKATWSAVIGFYEGIWEGIKAVFGGVKDWFTEIFQGAFDAVVKIFGGLIGVIKEPINFLIRGINTFIDGLNAIEIPDWVPGVGGKGIHIKPIQELAEGGVLKKGQVGLLEGSGAEAVVPLENNRGWIAATAEALKQAMTSEGIIGGTGTTGAQVINNYTFTQNNTSPKPLSRLDIYRQTQNQLDFAKGGA